MVYKSELKKFALFARRTFFGRTFFWRTFFGRTFFGRNRHSRRKKFEPGRRVDELCPPNLEPGEHQLTGSTGRRVDELCPPNLEPAEHQLTGSTGRRVDGSTSPRPPNPELTAHRLILKKTYRGPLQPSCLGNNNGKSIE